MIAGGLAQFLPSNYAGKEFTLSDRADERAKLHVEIEPTDLLLHLEGDLKTRPIIREPALDRGVQRH